MIQSQVDSIPRDSYSLSLYALDRTFNPRPRGATNLDFNLDTSPYVTRKDKHHAIYRTAHGIMKRLDQVVHEVSMIEYIYLKISILIFAGCTHSGIFNAFKVYEPSFLSSQVAPYCPGELDQLQHRPLDHETTNQMHTGRSKKNHGTAHHQNDDTWAEALSARASKQRKDHVSKPHDRKDTSPAVQTSAVKNPKPSNDLKRSDDAKEKKVNASPMSSAGSKSIAQKRWAPQAPLTPPRPAAQGNIQTEQKQSLSAGAHRDGLSQWSDKRMGSPQRHTYQQSPVRSSRPHSAGSPAGQRQEGGQARDDFCGDRWGPN